MYTCTRFFRAFFVFFIVWEMVSMQENERDGETEQRVNDLEKEYETRKLDRDNTQRMEELRAQIAGLIGKNNLNLLREYTDRLIARYNTETDWFYRKGMEDADRYSSQDGRKRRGETAQLNVRFY